MTRPAGVFCVPFGVVEVCHAGVRRTDTLPKSTVPPMFGSETFSRLCSDCSSLAISTIATTLAPVRLAISTVSPKWSAWPCVRKMWVGSSSSALHAAFGFPVRNGSMSTRVSPSLSSKAACPRKRISMRRIIAPLRLTSLSHGAGCACKLPAAELHALLADLPRSDDPNVLVGSETADDAAVYRVSDELAVVTTADFFTPIVDDPYDFGRIAATNALSDVYAMGGRPLTALNLVAFPLAELGGEVLREILRGGSDVAAAAGVAVVGGHSIDDSEPKYGMAVTGTVHPDKLVRNSTARVGDALFLTKPVGGGLATTALKRGLASEQLIRETVAVMTTLNRDAAVAAVAAGASAMTDVTGFGLLGHLHELALGSGVSVEVEAAAVPEIPGVMDLLELDEPPVAGGTRRNREWVEEFVDFSDSVPEALRWLLCDAMTSGGLLVAAADGPGVRIGHVTDGRQAGRIRVA